MEEAEQQQEDTECQVARSQTSLQVLLEWLLQAGGLSVPLCVCERVGESECVGPVREGERGGEGEGESVRSDTTH